MVDVVDPLEDELELLEDELVEPLELPPPEHPARRRASVIPTGPAILEFAIPHLP